MVDARNILPIQCVIGFTMIRILLLACALLPPWLSAQTFEEVAVASGIDFQPEAASYMGGGVAWFDFDGDGWQDLYVTGCRLRDRLYRNLGDGTFEEVGLAAGLGATEDINTIGVSTADFDRDGDPDVYVTTWRVDGLNEFAPNYLFRNNGDGTFTDVAAEAGLNVETFSICGTFFDANLDGWIDLWVGNYVIAPAFLFDEEGMIIGYDHDCASDNLYLNNGDGTFTDLALVYETENFGCTLATRNTDLEFDGDPDVLVGNDFGEYIIPNKLYRNNYPLELFSEISSPSNAAAQMYSMGIATGDYDHDGDLDHYITNLGRNLLMQKQEDTFFIDITTEADIENQGSEGLRYTSWATGFADFDHDGWEDLFVINGHVPTIDVAANHVFDPDKLYRNNGDGTFEDVSEAAGIADMGIGRGGALCDYDQDGDLDLAVVNIQNPASSETEGVRLYNNQNRGGGWIGIALEGTASNVDAIGALVKVHAGTQTWLREVSGGGDTHVSQHDHAVHIGLGATVVDSVTVQWPSGLVETVHQPAQSVWHHWTEGAANAVEESHMPSLKVFPNPASGLLQVHVPAGQAGTYVLMDAAGREVATWQWSQGNHHVPVDVYLSGWYVLRGSGQLRTAPVELLIGAGR